MHSGGGALHVVGVVVDRVDPAQSQHLHNKQPHCLTELLALSRQHLKQVLILQEAAIPGSKTESAKAALMSDMGAHCSQWNQHGHEQ